MKSLPNALYFSFDSINQLDNMIVNNSLLNNII